MLSDSKFQVQTCRACSNCFEYLTSTGKNVKVIVGMPATDVQYKAVSFVWGQTLPTPVSCCGCGSVKLVPMSSVGKLQRLLEVVGSGYVWLDALSIDQDDEDD